VLRRRLCRYNGEMMAKATETVEIGRCNPFHDKGHDRIALDAHFSRYDRGLGNGFWV
jgi:hypothetical protein